MLNGSRSRAGLHFSVDELDDDAIGGVAGLLIKRSEGLPLECFRGISSIDPFKFGGIFSLSRVLSALWSAGSYGSGQVCACRLASAQT